MTTTFEGFDPAALALLPDLPALDEAGYAALKRRLADGLRTPGLSLLHALAARFDPSLSVHPRSSVSPLHRDLRFAKPGTSRYKDHLLLTAWEGADRKTSPTLWLRVDAASVGFASGVAFTPGIRDRFRKAVAGSDGAELQRTLSGLRKRYPTLDVAGPMLKRLPAGFDADHPRADLLRMNGFQVRFSEPVPRSRSGPAFVDHCEKRWRALWSVHRFLVDAVVEKRVAS